MLAAMRVARPAVKPQRHVCAAQAQGTAPYPPPPPPPPPPQPPAATQTRRGLLSSLSFAGVAAAGGAVGYVFGSQSNTPLLAGLTDQDRKDIDELRAEAHFRRDYDGHVWVQERAGEWAEVRQDAQLAGTLLVRSASGQVSFFTMGLQQIDLTDDFVVAAVFGDGSWERVLQPLKAKDDNDQVVDVVLDQDSFRELISISI